MAPVASFYQFHQARLFWLTVIAIALVVNSLVLTIGGWVLIRKLGRRQEAPSFSRVRIRSSRVPSATAKLPRSSIQDSIQSLSTARLTSFRSGIQPSTAQSRILQGRILEYRLGNHSRDIPDRAAFPKKHHIIFPKAINNQRIRNDINQVIELRVLVNKFGNAETETAQILQSTGSATLDHIARLMLRRWQFEPARQNRQPVDSLLDVKFQIIFR